MALDAEDQQALALAVGLLEDANLVMEITSWLGKPIEFSMKQLPAKVAGKINAITTAALTRALRVALSTIDFSRRGAPARWLHRGTVAVTGGVGGAFGIAGAAVEIPISTIVMLRSIADIARAEGEDLTDAEARLACLEVFALGGSSRKRETSESAYFVTRAALARSVAQAATFVAERGAAEKGAPVLVRFVGAVAKRFAPVIAEKYAAESIPVLGAVGGATVNVIFMNHFQRVAQGHFAVRRLERQYGADMVRAEYERLRQRRTGAK